MIENSANTPAFPAIRMRRNRRTAWSRALVRENTLTAADLIWPIFVIDGENRSEAVASMPGVSRYSVDIAVARAGEAAALGIPAVALFPNTPSALRSADGAEAFNPDNLVCRRCGRSARPCRTSASCATWRSTPTPAMAMTG